MFRSILYYLHTDLRYKLPGNANIRLRTITALGCLWLLQVAAILAIYFLKFSGRFPLPHVPGELHAEPLPGVLGKLLGAVLVGVMFLPVYAIYGRKRVYEKMVDDFDALPEEERKTKIRVGKISFYCWTFGPVLILLWLFLKR